MVWHDSSYDQGIHINKKREREKESENEESKKQRWASDPAQILALFAALIEAFVQLK